jgi:hypothetical protein
MQTYLVEHYRPGLTTEALQDAAGRVRDAALALERRGIEIHYVRSTIVPGDEAFLSLFEAASEDAVRQAYSRAGVHFERISLAIPADGRMSALTGADHEEVPQ